MIEEQLQPEGQESAQQQDPPYRKKVYDLLRSNFSDFKRTEQEFYSKLDSDPQYYTKVYDLLSNNFSDFKRSKEEFGSMLGLKKKDAGVSPTPSQSQSSSDYAASIKKMQEIRKQFNQQTGGAYGSPDRPAQDNLVVPRQVAQKAQFVQNQIKEEKNAPKQMMVFTKPTYKYSDDTEKAAKIAGFQSAQQMYDVAAENEAKKQEKLQKAADELYDTFGGKLFYSVIQPLGTGGARGIGNFSASALRLVGLGEIADDVSNTFNPEKRWGGSIAGTTPTKLQGNLFNDGRLNWSKLVPSTISTVTDMAWLLGGASSGQPALRAIGASEKVARGGSLFASSYLQQRENYLQDARSSGLRGDQADVFATGAALLTSAIEPLFPNTIALGGFRKQLAKNYASQIAKGVSSKVALKEATKAVAKEAGFREPLQELTQLAGDKVAMALSDAATGQGNFRDRLEYGAIKDDVLTTLVMTPIASGLVSAPSAFRRYSPSNYEKSLFYEASKTPDILNQYLDNKYINKEITADEYKQAKTRFNSYKSAVDQVKELGYSDDQTIRMSWELFTAKQKLPENTKITADPVLREALGEEVKKDSENISNNIREIGMGVPSVGEEISGGDVSFVISNIGDKGVEIGQQLVDQIGDGTYRVEEVSVKGLYNSDPEFKQYVDTYKKGSIGDDAKLVPAVMKDNKIVDGRARLAEQFIAGKDNVKVFKNVIDAINESEVQEGRTEGDISQPAGFVQGQQEAGQGTGLQGQTQIAQADAGDSNINRQGEIVAPELSNIEIQPTIIAQNAAPFVNDVKVAAPEVETGSTMNIDGTQYTGGGLVVPAASMNTTIEEITPDMVAQFVEQNRGKISGDNFKVGIYKFPNSNRASIDLNIVVPAANRAAALEFGRAAGQESLFDLDTFENVKTGADGVNPRSFTDEQFREIANALANNRVPNVFGQQEAMQTEQQPAEQDVDTITRELLEELGLSNIDTIIANASQALADSGVTIDVVNDPVEYDNMVESMGGQRGTDGVFVAEDGKIILNSARLRSGIDAGRVIWHEASHPVMNIIRNTNRDLYDRAVRGAKEAAPAAFKWASENYESQESIDDETLVEATSMVADGTIDLAKLPTGFRQTLIDFVNSVAKMFGLDPVLSDTDLGAFRKLAAEVSEALKSGRSIEGIVGAENVTRIENTIGEASIENTENEFSNSAVQARFTTEFFEDSDSFDKLVEDGDVVHNAEMSSFDDQTVVIHNPDSFATGKIKFRGKDLVEGEGGIYFVLKFGDVWASSKQSTARQMANLINESLKNSTDGKARIVLIKGDPNKNLTSVKGAKALMGVIEILADDGLIPLSAFRKALNAAGKRYGVDFDGRNEAKSIHRDIQSKFMNVSNSSFERRGDFVRDVIDEIANQNVLTKEDISRIAESIGATRKMTTFSKASIIDSVAYATTERVLRDVPNSHAYAVIETSSPVEIKQDGRHESYPWHIVTQDGSRPKLYLLKDRPYFNNAFVAAKDTEKVKAGEAFGDVSRAGLAQRGMGLAKVALGSRTEKALQARVSNKSPKKGVNLIEEAGYDLGLTEDDKGNYLFFHFSNKDLTKSGIDPSKHGSSRQTSRQEAMQKPNVSYYYTTPSKESFTGDFGHVVAIPKHKVYPFQKDPLNLYDEAREAFLKDYPFGGFGPNQQIGWISKIAAKYGFEMVVGKWNGGMYRGETTIKHKPEFYSKPGLGINTTVFNPKYKDVVPNRKKKRKKAQARAAEEPQMSAGNRDNRVRAFIERKRSEGSDDATIRQAIKNALNISDADIDAIMAAQQAPTGMELEEARLDVEGEGREMERGLARRFDTLPSETVARIDEDAKTYFQQTNRQTIEAVEEFMKGKNVEDVADYVVAGPQIPDASLVFMAAITAKKLTPMIEQARQDGNQDLAKRLADKQAAIYNTFAQKATSLGQAVQAFIAFKDDPNATQFYLNKILNQLREKGVEVTKDHEDQIRELLSDVGNAKNGLPKDMAIIKLSSYLNSISPVNGVEVLEAIWYAKILSGITTQSKNLFANLFNTFFEIPVVATRESIKNKSLMPFLYAAKGAVSGFAKGSVVGADILRTGVKEQDIDKYFGNNILEYFSWGRTKIGQLGGGRVGMVLDFPAFIELSPKALRFVGRGLSAADAMFSSINQEAYANMMAWAQAVNEGKNQPAKNDYKRANEILGNTKEVIEKAKEDAAAEGFKPGTLTFKRRVIELVEDTRPKEIEQASEDFGKRVTLNYEPEGFIRPIYNMIVRAQQEARILKVWIPFTRIIANLTEQMLNYSPAGYYRAITGKRNPFGGGSKLTNDERADLAIKATMGLAAVGVLASAVGDEEDDWFEITANGTGNIQKNYELEKGGWRPFTITLKDGTKINYADWPIRGILAGIGAYRDGVNYGDSEDGYWDRTTLFSYGMMASMYESSLMKGLAEFIDVFRPEQTGKAENVGEGVSKWAAQQAKSVTLSNFTQQALKFVDEYQGDPMREAKGAAILYRDIPVLNDGLNPIIDVFGDPVSPKTSEKLVPAYTVPDEKKDKVVEFLNKRGIFLGVPKRPNFIDLNTMTETPATDEQWYNYRKTYGQAMKKYLYEFQESYKGEDDKMVKEYVSKIKEAASKEAKLEMYFGNKTNE